MSSPRLKPGAVLFTEGQLAYEFVTEVEEGNHGEQVLLARCRAPDGLRGDVYLKCIHLPEALDAEGQLARARLEEEVRLAEHLRHPGIAPVHGLKRVGETLYVIAECVEGNSLNTLIDLVPDRFSRYSDRFILYVGAQTANALAYAHTRTDARGQPLGIVHRAVDTARIWITWSGKVKLTDFGLALSKLSGRIASQVRRLHGDGYFSSPEALLGQPVDARSDLFQLGVVLCELATGTHPLDPPRGLPEHAERLLSARERAAVKAATRKAKAAGMHHSIERIILRAATYTPQDLEELTAKLAEPLRLPLRKLLQREPAARYPTAQEAEMALLSSLDRLGAYGAEQAAAELSERLAAAGGEMAGVGGSRSSQELRQRSWVDQTTR